MFPSWTLWSTIKPTGPPHHNDRGNGFKNPWESAQTPTWAEIIQNRFPIGWYEAEVMGKGKGNVSVVVPDWGRGKLEELEKGNEGGKGGKNWVVATCLGHAGVMVEIPLFGALGEISSEKEKGKEGKKSLFILFDPIFSPRAGPTQYTGPARLRPSPCQVDDLPGCDVVCISHNHYDHLDASTITSLNQRFPMCKYFVPLGNKGTVVGMGVDGSRVVELDWWNERELGVGELVGDGDGDGDGENERVRFTCVPAQHNSGRGALDQGTSLWCGWVIERFLDIKESSILTSNLTSNPTPSSPTQTQTKRIGAIYHAGDTGYRRTSKSPVICPIFTQIGSKFSSFDLAFIPIWRGGTLGFLSTLGLRLSHHDLPTQFHAGPADALDIAKDTRSRVMLGVHFGTFVGSVNESLEAVGELEVERERRGVRGLDELGGGEGNGDGNGYAGVVDIGGSLVVEVGERDVE